MLILEGDNFVPFWRDFLGVHTLQNEANVICSTTHNFRRTDPKMLRVFALNLTQSSENNVTITRKNDFERPDYSVIKN